VSIFASHKTEAKKTSGGKAGERLYYAFPNEKGLSSLKKNYKNIDVFAPQVYTVGFDLKIKDLTNDEKNILKEAKKKKVATMPLLVNEQFNQALMSTLLIQPQAQDDIIAFMIKEAKENKYIGWQFDFENLNHKDRYLYVAFVEKTYKALKKEKLLFSVAVIVRADEYNPYGTYQDWSSGYDYKNLGKNSDYLSLMTYDDPRSEGPVASLFYVRNVLNYMVKQVPPEKLSLGIPLYCWKWTGGIRTRSTTFDISIEELEEGTNGSQGYDSVFGNEWIKWKNIQNGQDYISWCDGVRGTQAKIDLINEYKLKGFSAWAIGQENKAFWKVVK
jgi:spore germination protein YaaH